MKTIVISMITYTLLQALVMLGISIYTKDWSAFHICKCEKAYSCTNCYSK